MISKKEILNQTKLELYKEIKKFQTNLKPTKEIEGFATTTIVSEKNYPNLKVHSISGNAIEDSFYNAQNFVKESYSKIIKHKAKSIFGSSQNINIKEKDSKIKQEIENIYKSKIPIDFTSEFEKELSFKNININNITGFNGSINPLLKLEANSNTKTSFVIEKYTQEDIKSKEAIINLYEKNINEQQIINLLALGNFGIEINKKMVPTRWAITAYDKTIEKYLHNKIINFNIINEYLIYEFEDKGNKFIIIILPNNLSFENYEIINNNIFKDFVDFKNKLPYLEPNTSGGFYATKIGIMEHLFKIKKQASIIVIRDIYNYELPLGVIFVRESIRECIKQKPIIFKEKEEFEKYLKEKHNKYYIEYLKSTTYKYNRINKKLTNFL